MWLWEVEDKTVEQLSAPETVFMTLDMKLIAAIVECVPPVMEKDMRRAQERRLLESPPGVLSGRQALRMLFDHFEPDKALGQLFDFRHLEAVRLNGVRP